MDVTSKVGTQLLGSLKSVQSVACSESFQLTGFLTAGGLEKTVVRSGSRDDDDDSSSFFGAGDDEDPDCHGHGILLL